MTLTINGDKATFGNSLSVTELLQQLGYEASQRLAVAVNLEFIPRSAQSEHQLKDGDDVEIVAPMQGG